MNVALADPNLANDAPTQPAVSAPAIRVLHLVNGEHYAGAERVQDLLALHLPQFGVQVGFVCLKEGRFAAERKSQDVPLEHVAMKRKFDLRAAFRVARIIRAGGYSILHTHTPRSALIGRIAAALARVPLVHHIHGQTATEVNGTWKARFNAWVEKFCFWRAARIIAVSGTAGKYLQQQGVPAQRVQVVANGIPVQDLADRDEPRGLWTLGTVGLFRPRKGIEVLLEALALLKRQGCQVRWIAVGSCETPSYESQLKAMANELELHDSVQWRGFSSNVKAELALFDAFVFPSILPEGMPMVVLEAMAAGVPVVATRVDGVTDVIRDGEDGLLARPNDAADLARTIKLLADDEGLYGRLRRNAHRKQQSQFSADSMAAQVAVIYRSILAN